MKVIDKILDKINLFLALIGGIVLGLLLIAICFATISRFLFNKPFSNLVELSSYSLIFITFFAAPWLLQQRKHMAVDIIVNMLKPNQKLIMSTFSNILGFLISATITYVGANVTLDYLTQNIKIMDSMQTPQWVLLSAIPIGALFLSLQFIRNIRDDVQHRNVGKSIDEETIELVNQMKEGV